MTDNSLFLTKIEHHYNFQTKLTPCIDIELAVNCFKRILNTASKHVTMRLMGPESGPLKPRAWTLPCLRIIVTPPKVLPCFAHWLYALYTVFRKKHPLTFSFISP